jgi:hypothetical protein
MQEQTEGVCGQQVADAVVLPVAGQPPERASTNSDMVYLPSSGHAGPIWPVHEHVHVVGSNVCNSAYMSRGPLHVRSAKAHTPSLSAV